MVNQTDVFVERVRLRQHAANQPVRFRELADLLAGTRIRFVEGHSMPDQFIAGQISAGLY